MPLVRIDLLRGKASEYRRVVGKIVYDAMVDVLKSPENDLFQTISEYDEENFVFDPSFFGIERTNDLIFVQITLVGGRTIEQKRAFYKWVAVELNDKLGLRQEDIFISLIGTDRSDWSFGNGEASLIDP